LLTSSVLFGLAAGVGIYTFVYAKGYSYLTNFTIGAYPDPLRITPRNHAVTERACRNCHAELTASIDPGHSNAGRDGLTCTQCHNDVGHIE
jgi:cytochrome c nitrite reductase small subunit